MDDRSHQPQHAAGALEPLQCGPVIVQAVEDLRVDGVAGNHPVAVLHLFDLRRKIAGVGLVQLAELGADPVAGLRVLAVKEEAAAHDFKAFVGGNRFPDGFHPPEGVLDGLQCGLSRFAADLNIRFRDGSHHKAVLAGAGGFGDLLNKGDEVVERTSGQTLDTVDALCVCHQLVHQHQTGAAGIEQIFQCFAAGRNALFVGFLHKIVQFRPPGGFRQLCRHFAPQSIDGDTGEVDGPFGACGVQCGAHKHRHICLGQGRYPCLRQYRLDVGNAVCRYLAPHHVVKRQHTVGLAAAKGGFQLDDRFAILSADPLECLHQQTGHALGDVGAGKKLHRVTVFKGTLAPCYLR